MPTTRELEPENTSVQNLAAFPVDLFVRPVHRGRPDGPYELRGLRGDGSYTSLVTARSESGLQRKLSGIALRQ